MKERFRLYSSLFTDQKSSKTDLDDFSQYKNHEYPLTLSDYRKLQKPTAKSDFIKCLSQEKNQSHNNAVSVGYKWPYLDTILIVSAKMVQANAPNLAKIYKVYSKTEIEDKTVYVFQNGSQKRETCEDCGKNDPVRLPIKENNPIYRTFAKVLTS